MAQATALPTPDLRGEERLRPTRRRLWRTRGLSLTTRILAVNVIALALLAGGFFYLDSYRTQLINDFAWRAPKWKLPRRRWRRPARPNGGG